MRQLLARFRPFFVYAGLFSMFINLLQLVPVLYMLQIFDRVIASRSDETLVVLTIGAVLADIYRPNSKINRTEFDALFKAHSDEWYVVKAKLEKAPLA